VNHFSPCHRYRNLRTVVPIWRPSTLPAIRSRWFEIWFPIVNPFFGEKVGCDLGCPLCRKTAFEMPSHPGLLSLILAFAPANLYDRLPFAAVWNWPSARADNMRFVSFFHSPIPPRSDIQFVGFGKEAYSHGEPPSSKTKKLERNPADKIMLITTVDFFSLKVSQLLGDARALI
jgi:hypothetical protein